MDTRGGKTRSSRTRSSRTRSGEPGVRVGSGIEKPTKKATCNKCRRILKNCECESLQRRAEQIRKDLVQIRENVHEYLYIKPGTPYENIVNLREALDKLKDNLTNAHKNLYNAFNIPS